MVRPSRRRNRLAKDPADPTRTRELPMLYAILAYHVEAEVMSWTRGGGRGGHDRSASRSMTGSTRRPASARRRVWARRRRPAPCEVRARASSSTVRLPRPRSSCWASTSWIAPTTSRDRGCARAAPRQSERGLRDPPGRALSSRGPLPEDGGCRRRYVRPERAQINVTHLGSFPGRGVGGHSAVRLLKMQMPRSVPVGPSTLSLRSSYAGHASP